MAKNVNRDQRWFKPQPLLAAPLGDGSANP